jgi:hypothetical protein
VLIKVLLLACIAAFGVLAMRGAHSAARRAMWRLAGVAVLTGGAVSVVVPELLTWLAHRLGIGRGTDLLLYALAVTFLFVVAVLFRRIAELEQRCIVLARSIALVEAERAEAADLTSASRPGRPAA